MLNAISSEYIGKLQLINDLIHYDNRTLFESLTKKRLIKSVFTKSVIRGHIPNLEYGVHHVMSSPVRNISCTNNGHILKNNEHNCDGVGKINTEKAYIMHFPYKSTEEFINKYKRGFDWFHDKKKDLHLKRKIRDYYQDNKMTKEKIEYIERELNISIKDIWK